MQLVILQFTCQHGEACYTPRFSPYKNKLYAHT